MSKYVLDTSALLCLRDDESGAERVASLIEGSAVGDSPCLACFMSLMELLYRVWKDEGEAAGRQAYAQALQLPIEWVHESATLLERGAAVKALHALSVADAWIAATALEHDAVLVHKDPEFEALAEIEQDVLPYRELRSR